MKIVLRKSLIAIAVAMAASPVMALTMNGIDNGIGSVGSYGNLVVETQDFDNIIIAGEYNGRSDGVVLGSVNVIGNVTNSGRIISEDSLGDNYPTAIDIGSVDLRYPVIWGRATAIGGSIINSGDLTAKGIGATGLRIRNTEVAGNVTNSGDIEAIARNEQDAGRAIDLNGSIIGGNVTNSGDVSIDGWNTIALNIINGSVVKGGQIVNSGKLSATGKDVSAVHLEDLAFNGTFINSGMISASGEGATGIDFDRNSTVDSLVNTGSIGAFGTDSVAVLVDGATFGKGIVNTGSIIGDVTGIEVDIYKLTSAAAEENQYFQIVQAGGLIKGGVAAIEGHELTDLKWSGGSIDGDLKGLSKVSITGLGEFFGGKIEAWGGLNIAENSQLNLNAVSTYLEGDLLIESGGALGLPISSMTPSNKAVFLVDGKATLEQGSQLVMNAKGNDFASDGQSYTLLSANDLVNNGVSVSSSSAVLNIKSIDVGDRTLSVTIAPKSNTDIKDIIAHGGGSGNTQRAGAAFVGAASSLASSNPNDPVLKAIIDAGTDSVAVARIAKQLSPEVNTGASNAAIGGQHLVSTAVGTRMSSVRQGMSSGEGFSKVGGWIQILNNDANQSERDGIDGYDASSQGFAIGVDGQLNDATVLGLAYSFVDTDIDSESGNETQVDSNSVTGYGSWTYGQFFADGSVTYGQNRNKSTRYIAGTEAKASYDSNLFGLNALGGYVFDINNGLVLEPRVAARYSVVNIDGFTEKGSSASLKTGDQRMEVGELGAGLRLAGQFEVAGGILEPEIKAMAFHDFIGDTSNSTSTYVLGGNSFVTSGASASRDSYELGLGATYRKGDITLGLGYDRLTKTGFKADVMTAKVRYDF